MRTKDHIATHGQLFLRYLDDATIVVGFLEIKGFSPDEKRAYFIDVSDGVVRLALLEHQHTSTLTDEHYGLNVDSLLRQPVWHRTLAPDIACVRFIRPFDDRDEFVIYGLASLPFMDHMHTPNGAWAKIEDGYIRAIEAPFPTNGMLPGQTLTNVCWRSVDGKLYGLPCNPNDSKESYNRLHNLMADMADGLIGEQELKQRIKDDPKLDLLKACSIDHEFALYLAEIRAAEGVLKSPWPISQEEDEVRRAIITKSIKRTTSGMR